MSHKETQDTLAQKLVDANSKVTVGARYEHYKHLEYTVLQVALIEESNEPCVVYRAEYGDHLVWVRPLSNWLERVKLPDGTMIPRFSRIS